MNTDTITYDIDIDNVDLTDDYSTLSFIEEGCDDGFDVTPLRTIGFFDGEQVYDGHAAADAYMSEFDTAARESVFADANNAHDVEWVARVVARRLRHSDNVIGDAIRAYKVMQAEACTADDRAVVDRVFRSPRITAIIQGVTVTDDQFFAAVAAFGPAAVNMEPAAQDDTVDLIAEEALLDRRVNAVCRAAAVAAVDNTVLSRRLTRRLSRRHLNAVRRAMSRKGRARVRTASNGTYIVSKNRWTFTVSAGFEVIGFTQR